MEPAYQAIEQRREFTQADFDRYRAKMFPYDTKVDGRELLSEEDILFLERMKEEIRGIYTVESLSKVRPDGYITGHIESILGLDELRKRHGEDTKLEAEAKGLEQELCSLRAIGELTPKKEKESYRRITEIYKKICPYH